MALAVTVCACGGGGGGGSGSSSSQQSAIVTSVSSAFIPAGTTFIVTGINLNLVASWLLGGSSLTVVGSSSTLVTLQAPNTLVSGNLAFVDTSRNSVTTSFALQTYVPIRVSQLSPNAQAIGQPVTMSGTGLDAITAIALPNASSSDAPATITAQSATSLTFLVPVYAQSGSLTLTSPYEGRVITAQTLSISPRIWSDWLTQEFSGADLNILLQGANLDQVSSATVGPIPATLSNQSVSSLTLTVPRATRGAIVLNSTNQPSRTAGAIDTVASASTTFLGMSFGQVLEEEADSPQLRLTPGKPAGVRAFISSAVAGVPSPVVTLTATNGAATLGTLTMAGPSTLPTTVPRYDAVQTFNAVLPAAWVSPGLTVQISYTPSGAASPLSLTEQPPVGNSTTLNLVVVPINIGSFTGAVPSTPIRELLAQAFPYPFANINVTTRAVFAVSGLTAVRSPGDIGSVLTQLETIRTQEAPNSIYYGLISDSALQTTVSGGRVIGVGWVNDTDTPSSTWKLSAVGTDSRSFAGYQDSLGTIWAQWQRTMVHELGHVHSRYHAPCGGAGGPDPNFPYASGVIGRQPIYASFYTSDTAFGSVGSPSVYVTGAAMADIMSYCPGAWFSDYNYYYVQRFAEKYSGAVASTLAPLAAVAAVKEESAFLVLSGEIGPGSVKLLPALLISGIVGDASSPSSGYQIIVKTVDGTELTRNLSPLSNSEDPDTAHFSVSIPASSRLASVQFRKYGVTLPSDAPANATSPSVNPTWQQDTQGLAIKWNASIEPYLSVFRVTRDGKRQVLVLFATGGELRVPAADIAGVGVDIQLSTTLNARKLRLIAP